VRGQWTWMQRCREWRSLYTYPGVDVGEWEQSGCGGGGECGCEGDAGSQGGRRRDASDESDEPAELPSDDTVAGSSYAGMKHAESEMRSTLTPGMVDLDECHDEDADGEYEEEDAEGEPDPEY
jgi:hypothetical protein